MKHIIPAPPGFSLVKVTEEGDVFDEPAIAIAIDEETFDVIGLADVYGVWGGRLCHDENYFCTAIQWPDGRISNHDTCYATRRDFIHATVGVSG